MAWLAVLAICGVTAVWGFGQGSIFERMKSSESMVPGSESDDVYMATTSGQGEALSIVVKGADPVADAEQIDTVLSEFEAGVLNVDGVEEILDPVMVGTMYKQETEAAIADAVAGAVQQATKEAEAATEGLPQAQRDAAIQQAVADAEAQAREAATAEAAKTPNPAQAFYSDKGDGFATIVKFKADLTDSQQDASYAEVMKHVETFKASLAKEIPAANATMTSNAEVHDEIMEMVASDLVRGESIGMPIALLLLVIVFGGLMAAGLPMVGAMTSIGVGMGALWALTHVMDVDSFVLNIVSIIGLALSIDYGLLVVARYREEVAQRLVARGLPDDGSKLPDDVDELVSDAVRQTVATAGRTVSFSALTIAFSISALLTMQATMLKVISIAGILVALLAVLTAVTFVPAVIRLLGARLLRPSVITRIPVLKTAAKKLGDSASDEGFFSRLAHWVHGRPWLVMAGVGAILVVMALPIRDLSMRSNLLEYVPDDSQAGVAMNLMDADYPALATPSVTVLAETTPENAATFAKEIASIDGVTRVADPVALDNSPYQQINVFVDAEDQVGKEVTHVVSEVRDLRESFPVKVGGMAAFQKDFNDSVVDRAPLALLIVVLAVMILLFLMTGSLIVPLKALIINSLSLISSLGVTTWIFENGYLGLPQVNGLETFVLACAVAFGFGLAMDYEVFLLARIKEFWDAGETNDRAVEMGLQRSGRIITSAAAIIIAVFVGFIFGDMLAVKEIGVALAIIVAVDATLVRMLLVPATMTVLGRWNWWAPKPLKKVYDRFKIVH